MKTLTFVLSLAVLLGIVTLGFAGNNPFNPPKGNAKFATESGKVKANASHDNIVAEKGGLVVQKPGNGICPVMNHKITSKHNAVVTLSNGKHMEVCCMPCKDLIEKDLSKFEAYQY